MCGNHETKRIKSEITVSSPSRCAKHSLDLGVDIQRSYHASIHTVPEGYTHRSIRIVWNLGTLQSCFIPSFSGA